MHSNTHPQPQSCNACRLSRTTGLGCSLFARRYWGNRCLLSVPEGTEMFHFPSFAWSHLCIQCAMTGYLPPPGFPIRTSPDQCLFSGSPRLFAAIHVLHRRLMPRHPPYALLSLIRLFPLFLQHCNLARISITAHVVLCISLMRVLSGHVASVNLDVSLYPLTYEIVKDRFLLTA